MLKFFDVTTLSDQTRDKVTELADQLAQSGAADNRDQLAKDLLNLALQRDPALDKAQAAKTIRHYVMNPDFLLFVAGAATLFGNASYVSQYSDLAGKTEGTERALNLMHMVIFSSFTLEKIVDIGKSGLSTGANMSRRESLKQMMGFLKNNYPLAAGGWLTLNQVASGSTFAAQAAHNDSSKEAVTAGTRALAASASLGMTLYKYHSILKKERETGEKLVDERIRRIIDPIDRMLGGTVDAMGGAFPYLAAAMLTGPHISIFYNRLTDKEHPKVSWASISTTIGYSAFVAYLASRPDSNPEKAVEAEVESTLEMRQHFEQMAQILMDDSAKPKAQSMRQRLENAAHDSKLVGKKAAHQLARATLRHLPNHYSQWQLLEQLARQVSEAHVASMQHALPEGHKLEHNTAHYLAGQLGALLLSGLQEQKEKLEAIPAAEEGQINRRELLFGWRR